MKLTIEKNNEVSIEKIESKDEVSTTETKHPKAGFYDKVLTPAAIFFNYVRIYTYFPTIYAIYFAKNSDQHSLWTWCLWSLANAFTSAFLFKKDKYIYTSFVNSQIGNVIGCLLTLAFIVYYRLN